MKDDMKSGRGFSLLELLVTLAVIALLAFMVTSSNQEKVTKLAVMQAQLDLLALASKMEEFRLANSTYIGAAGTETDRAATGKPWVFSNYSPSSNTEQHSKYILNIQRADDTSYTLIALPRTTRMQRLSYNSRGEKFRDINSDGVFTSDENCWKC